MVWLDWGRGWTHRGAAGRDSLSASGVSALKLALLPGRKQRADWAARGVIPATWSANAGARAETRGGAVGLKVAFPSLGRGGLPWVSLRELCGVLPEVGATCMWRFDFLRRERTGHDCRDLVRGCQ